MELIIGVDARPLSYPLTGIGIYLRHLLERLQEIDRKNRYVLISNASVNFQVRSERWKTIHGACRKKLLSTPWMQAYAPRIARHEKINLFWGPRHHLPLFLDRRVKTVLTVHDVVNRLYPETMALSNLLAERILMGSSIKRADAVITDARITVGDIHRHFQVSRKRITAIQPGVPELNSNTSDRVNRPKNYFIFVGTLDPRKNFRRILEAFCMLGPEKRELHLVITGGKGWKNKAFLRELAVHPQRKRIHLTGYATRNELTDYYRNALGLLFPSIYEGFGFPVVEAMSVGCPVITSKISSMPEVAGDAAILVDPFCSVEIAEAMAALLDDPERRAELIRSGYARIRRFSWTRCAEAMLRIFEKVSLR